MMAHGILSQRFPWLRQFLQDDLGEEQEAKDIGGQKVQTRHYCPTCDLYNTNRTDH